MISARKMLKMMEHVDHEISYCEGLLLTYLGSKSLSNGVIFSGSPSIIKF